MRKKTRRSPASKSPKQKVLQLSWESIRTLTSEELSQAVHGAARKVTCPTGTTTDTSDI
jgi:hypothetical protein